MAVPIAGLVQDCLKRFAQLPAKSAIGEHHAHVGGADDADAIGQAVEQILQIPLLGFGSGDLLAETFGHVIEMGRRATDLGVVKHCHTHLQVACRQGACGAFKFGQRAQ